MRPNTAHRWGGARRVRPPASLVGDAEGVVIIPRHLADEVAKQAAEQEEREDFLLEKIRGGASIVGTYPAEGKTLEEYEESKRSTIGARGARGKRTG